MGFFQRLFGGRSTEAAVTEEEIGRVEDYFAKVGVIALKLGEPLAVGDRIRVKGHTTDFTQPVKSIQIEHESVERAKRGASVGIRVKKRCRRGDRVYRQGA
ncbi:MAG: translation elongation factor-like protein [Myxococcota bacterium]|jgi:translation elongation factor EF-1alpha